MVYLNKVGEKMEKLKNLEKVLINTEKFKKIIINVMIVQKCNFNDTFYIADKEILIEEIKDSKITYFDPFLGKSANNKIKIAIACINDDAFYVIKDENNIKEVIKQDNFFEVVLTENNDGTTFLASHIRLSSL